MSVVVSRQEVDSWRTELRIEVPQPAVAAETDRVVGAWRAKVKMPGFRKGKVPADVVKKRHRDEIEREVAERLISRYWQQAQAETGIVPLMPPLVDEVQHEFGVALSFLAKVDARPPVELGPYRSWELPEAPAEASDEEIDLALEDLQRSAGTWATVDRPAGRGDRVVGEIEEIGGSEGPQRLRVEVGGRGSWEELTIALTGLAAGQSITFDSVRNNQPTSYRVRAEAVEELTPAVLDDELATKMGVADVAALRAAVGDRLADAKRDERRQRRESAFLKRLVEEHPLDPPERMVESELRSMLEDYARDLHRRGVDVERAELDWARIGDEMKPQAKRRIQIRLLLDAIVAHEKVEVDEEHLESTLATLARSQKISAAQLRHHLAHDGRLTRLRQDLAREKAMVSILDL
jgi:trigger factor